MNQARHQPNQPCEASGRKLDALQGTEDAPDLSGRVTCPVCGRRVKLRRVTAMGLRVRELSRHYAAPANTHSPSREP